MRELLEGRNDLALVAKDGHRRAIGAVEHVGVVSVKVGACEVMKVAGIGRGGPCATEDAGVIDLELESRPASAGMAVEESACGTCVHAVFRFQIGNELGGEGSSPGTIVD